MSLNKCMFIGNCTREVEVRMTPNGQKVGSLSIAVNDRFKDKSGNVKESVEFINLVFWRRQCEIAEQYLKKGSQIYVSGKYETQSWEKDGQKQYKVQVVVSSFQMLGGPKGEAQPQKQNNQPSNQVGQDAPPSYDDNLPF